MSTQIRKIFKIFNIIISKIKDVLNKEFANVCKWFVDIKLSIHFGEDKITCILFSKCKSLPELNVIFDNKRIKQFHIAEYLGCYMDANLSGESTAMKSLKKAMQSYSSYIDKMSF